MFKNNLILIALFSLILPACLGSKVDVKAEETRIKYTILEQKKAWNNNDLEGYMNGYAKTDELVFITSNGKIHGWDTVFNMYKKAYPNPKAMGALAFSDLEIDFMTPALANVYGEWKIHKEHDTGGHFSLIIRKGPDGWKIIRDHTW